MVPNKKYMQAAIDVAWRGIKEGQTPFGATIVKNDEIVVSAHNVVWQTVDITAHAEINAIRLACKKLNTINLSDCIIYSTCEPCPMCFSACHWANISHIVFGTFIPDAKKIGFNELQVSNQVLKDLGASSVKIVEGFMQEEAHRLFYEWAKLYPDKSY